MQSREGQLAQILDQNFKILEIIFWNSDKLRGNDFSHSKLVDL